MLSVAKTRFLFRTTFTALSLLAATTLASACSSSDDRKAFEEPPPATEPVFTGSDAGATPDDSGFACVSEKVVAESVPLAMLVLIDRSGSMQGDEWTSATTAIRAFADRSEVVGMKMGLNFFPPLGGGDECAISSYRTPAVGIAPLPDNVIPIQQKIASASPTGGTPMKGGLDGSIAAMRDFLEREPSHEGVIILVTDGDPAGCGTVADVVASAAAGAKPGDDGDPRVRTFAVGMDGASFGSLDQIAVAGDGFPKAFNVGGGAKAQQALVDALEQVRTGAIGCEYQLPLPSSDKGVLDLNSVEVQFTPGGNDPQVNIKKVDGKEACGAKTGGYYYDDPANPKRVVLCPASCEDVRGAPAVEANVQLVFGCIQVAK